MSKQSTHPLVPGLPVALTIAVYRPVVAGQQAGSTPVETIEVDDPRAIGQLVELLNDLRPAPDLPAARRLPSSGAHDLLHFEYPDGASRTIKVKRDGYQTVSVEGLSGSWGTILPLHATIDSHLPVTLRVEIGHPAAYPPSENPQYISEEKAIAIALG